MSSISEKFKKQKKKIQAMIAMRGKNRWYKHPDVQNRLETFFDPICSFGIYGVYKSFEAETNLDLSLMPAFEENLTTGRNRNKHLGCYEATRVNLTQGPQNYIHANYISTPGHPKRMIATQAPLDKTAADFWYMVLQEESEIIISLCPVDEKPYALCDKRADTICSNYYAHGNGDFFYFNDGHLTVVTCWAAYQEYKGFEFKPMVDTPSKVYVREIEIIVRDERKFTCRHFYLVCDENITGKINCIPMTLLEDLPKTEKPIVVHCRDGVGLTGCFVMFQYYLDMLKTDLECEILPPTNYLPELRKQRYNIVKSAGHYLFIHMVLLQYFRQKTQKDHKFFAKFAKDYKTQMRGVDLESL